MHGQQNTQKKNTHICNVAFKTEVKLFLVAVVESNPTECRLC